MSPPINAPAMLPPPRKAIFMTRTRARSCGALVRFPRAEDRGADAHHRRAFRDRDVHVVGHAERERIEAMPGLQAVVELLHGTVTFARRAGLRNRHEPAELDPFQSR